VTVLMDDLADYLTGAGIAVPIQKGTLAQDPDDVLAMRETGGFPSQHVSAVTNGYAVLEEPTVQILARSASYNLAEQTIRLAFGLLDGLRERTLNGIVYYFITAMQPPFFLERDDNDRYVLAFNIHVRRQTTP
jgi:hypothetical protein